MAMLLQLSLCVLTVSQLTSSQPTYDVTQHENDVNSCGRNDEVLSALAQLQRDVDELKVAIRRTDVKDNDCGLTTCTPTMYSPVEGCAVPYDTSIPAACCSVPYTLNGELYHNCTVNRAVSNDFGCFNNKKQWVTCQQPQDFVAEYKETSTTALSADRGVAVSLLTINGWILMQRKVTGGSVSFNQNWATYRDGFGSATGNDNYWLGLDKVYRLVQLGRVSLRVEK